jgi:hypothetical protein
VEDHIQGFAGVVRMSDTLADAVTFFNTTIQEGEIDLTMPAIWGYGLHLCPATEDQLESAISRLRDRGFTIDAAMKAKGLQLTWHIYLSEVAVHTVTSYAKRWKELDGLARQIRAQLMLGSVAVCDCTLQGRNRD